MPQPPDERKHSPTPWERYYEPDGSVLYIEDQTGDAVITPEIEVDQSGRLKAQLSSSNLEPGQFDADMQFMLTAVNCHDELLDVCQRLVRRLGDFDVAGDLLNRAEAVMAKATAPFSDVAPI